MGVYVYVRMLDVQVYENKVLPAYRKFVRGGDAQPLIVLAEEAIAKMTLREKRDFDYVTLSEGVKILDGSVFYNSKGDYRNKEKRKTTLADKKVFVSGQLAPSLLFTLCTPRIRGLSVEQDMSKTALYDYLYYCSEWVQKVFAFGKKLRGEYLKISMGEGFPQFFSDEDIQEFKQVMREVANPRDLGGASEIYAYFRKHLKAHLKKTFPGGRKHRDAEFESCSKRFEYWLEADEAQLKKDFNNLVELLRLASEQPHLRLVFYITI